MLQPEVKRQVCTGYGLGMGYVQPARSLFSASGRNRMGFQSQWLSSSLHAMDLETHKKAII